jgi:hypothetical protein
MASRKIVELTVPVFWLPVRLVKSSLYCQHQSDDAV